MIALPPEVGAKNLKEPSEIVEVVFDSESALSRDCVDCNKDTIKEFISFRGVTGGRLG